MYLSTQDRAHTSYAHALFDVLHGGPPAWKQLLVHIPEADGYRAYLDGVNMGFPSVKVWGAYWRLRRHPNGNVCVALRTPESFGNRHATHNTALPAQDDLFLQEALLFSEVNWGDKLIRDNASGAIRAHLLYPDMEAPFATIFAQLKRVYNDIIRDCDPQSRFASMFGYATDNKLYGQELVGLSPHDLYYCALCGHPFGKLTRCRGCDTHFPRLPLAVRLTALPTLAMPPALIEKFKQGSHKFTTDPARWATASK